MKQHTPDELTRIFQSLAGQGLWAPLPVIENETEVGPLAMVYIRWSDLSPSANALEDAYWDAVQSVPRIGALGVLALINNILVMGSQDPQVHLILNQRFLSGELQAKVANYRLEPMAHPARQPLPVVFNHLSCLLLMRHIILYGRDSIETAEIRVEDLGQLALLANEFTQRDTLPISAATDDVELPLQFAPVWDIYNPPDLAYALPRMFTTLTEILQGGDSEVGTLTSRLGLDPSSVTSSGIGLVDLVSVVFGLYAFGSKVGEVGKDALHFENQRIFEKAQALRPALQIFLRERSLSAAEFQQRFGPEQSGSRQAFNDEMRERTFLASGINFFRQFPLLRIDENRTAILDLQFLVDLGTSGVFWSIFDSLPMKSRDTFTQLWGRLLELYTINMLQQFYPAMSGLLRPDVVYSGGQIDALLDFATSVVVFEIKGSRLSLAATRRGDRTQFEKEVKIKFVENEKGEPKVVRQLARSTKAIADGLIQTTAEPARIYPLFVGDEPSLQSTGFNTYLNGIFQSEMARYPTVRPLTVMTIWELEEMLPYVSENAFTWADLFETRFSGSKVAVHSIHQAIFDWRHARGVAAVRSRVILKRFEQLFEKMKESYGFQQ